MFGRRRTPSPRPSSMMFSIDRPIAQKFIFCVVPGTSQCFPHFGEEILIAWTHIGWVSWLFQNHPCQWRKRSVTLELLRNSVQTVRGEKRKVTELGPARQFFACYAVMTSPPQGRTSCQCSTVLWVDCFDLQLLNPEEVGDSFAEDFCSRMPDDKRVEAFCDYMLQYYIDGDRNDGTNSESSVRITKRSMLN